MATTLWSEFIPRLMLDAPGLSQPLAEQLVLDAAMDFCKRSWCWLYDQSAITLAPRVQAYDLEPPAGAQVCRIHKAWVDAQTKLEPLTMAELAERYGDYTQAEGTPEAFLQEVHDQIILVPKPTARASLTAKLSVTPKRTATGIDSKIADEYFLTLIEGAKALAFKMPKKDWTDLQLAAVCQAKVDAEVAAVRMKVKRGLVGAPMRVKPRFM